MRKTSQIQLNMKLIVTNTELFSEFLNKFWLPTKAGRCIKSDSYAERRGGFAEILLFITDSVDTELYEFSRYQIQCRSG